MGRDVIYHHAWRDSCLLALPSLPRFLCSTRGSPNGNYDTHVRLTEAEQLL